MSDSPFTMPGSQNLGKGNQSVSPGKYTASPAKDTGDHKHTDEDKTKHPVTETRGKNSITKSGDGESSTYKLTSSKPGKNKGETVNVYTNELGNTETRVVSAA